MAAHEMRIDKESGKPLYVQVYEFARDGIVTGAWKPGDKLPSIRALADELGIARNTIDSAYRQLAVEGYVKSKRGSGYIVQEVARKVLDEAARPAAQDAGHIVAEPVHETYAYDFRYGDLCEGVFPMDVWRRIAGNVLSDANAAEIVRYHEKRGDYGLRAQIAAHLGRMRGVSCEPEQIVVTNGTQQSMALVLGLFDASKDIVAVDDPGYYGAHVIVRNTGFQMRRLRTDAPAATYLADVRDSHARLLYTTPSHQFPMGWCMDQNTRSQLLVQAMETDAFILEDDYDSGYRYSTRSVPSLQSLDKGGRVVYMGTFSKILSPAMRMSYMVLPPALLERYEQGYRDTRPTTSWIDQSILRQFMESGQWQKHVRRTTLLYRKRCELVMETLAASFDGRVKVHGGDAGLFVLLEVENGMSQEELIAAAAKRDVRVYGTKRFWLDAAHAPDNLVLLGFSAISDDKIRAGIPLLRQAWFPD